MNTSKILLLVVLSVVLVYQEYSLYQMALKQGELNYKYSNRMYLALKSAYHFGYTDAHEGRREDWDGPNQ